jgi:hypothetical protein
MVPDKSACAGNQHSRPSWHDDSSLEALCTKG